MGQKFYLQEDSRTVTDINSTITVKTNPYFGPGNEINQKNPRPVTWCKQTEDKIINENEVSKSRELYESSVYPASYLIQSLGIGNTIVYVDNIRPFFDPINENANTSFQKAITIVSQDDCIAAGATATVAVDGTIASLNLYNNGKNYSNNPTVSITNSGIVNAEATAVVSDGIVINLNIDNPGLGYTSTNPPNVLISSPTLKSETDDVTTYSGDSGVIVGFGTTSISSKDYFIFDFHIPYDSYLRDNTIVGTAVTLSSIDVGDYFVVYNSNIGIANTSIYSKDLGNNTIGIGTDYVDNVYQVEFVENVEVNVVGIGTTIVRRTYVKVSHIPPITFDSTIITFDSTVYTFDSI